MTDLRQMFKSYEESRGFHTLVNLDGVVDHQTFVTKSGELLQVIAFRGKDVECLEVADIDVLSRACKAALRAFDERFILNTYLLKRSRPSLTLGTAENPVVNEALKNRHAFLNSKSDSLFSVDAFMTVLLKPDARSPRLLDRVTAFGRNPLDALKKQFDVGRRSEAIDEEIERALRILKHATASFLEQTGETLASRLLDADEAYSFFRRLLNPDGDKAHAIGLTSASDLDDSLVDSELECYRDYLRLDNYFIKTLTLKQLPSRTFAAMLSDLVKVRSDLVVVTEWSALEPTAALAKIRSKRRHAHNTKVGLFSQLGSERPYERELLFDDSKEAVVSDLGECLKAIEMRGVHIGEFSLSVVIIGATLEEAERSTAEVMKAVGRHEGSLTEERYNGLNAFLATLPAGHPYNLRRLLITDENYADIVPWFLPAEGEKRNTFLGADCLVAFETEDQSLYHFNLHVQDVPHTLVLGATGSGKSFLMNFLLTCAQQYEPYTFIFDVGGSYRWFTQLHHGACVSLRPEDRSWKINTFCLEPTERNLEFLYIWVKLLIESDGTRLTDAEGRDLYEAIRALYVLEAEQRRLLTLATTLPRKTGSRLKRWTEGEQYGGWFDHAEDTVTFSRMQYFDCEGMERLGIVGEPYLFYMLHRTNEVILDPGLATTFKLAAVDEAWRFLRTEATRDYIISAMRTWRKKNAAMILSTQSLQDLAGAEVFRPLLDSCPTKLLLSSPALDAGFYGEALRLNATEIEKVRTLAAKREFLLKRDDLAKVLTLNVDPKSYWLFTTNPYESKRRQELVDQVGLQAALEILAGGSI